MSAETLRRAAALMRSRAEKAKPGRYGFTSRWTTPTTMLTRITRKGGVVAEARGEGDSLYDLNHLSHWHPDVALAVADWLDGMALSMTHPSGGASTLREERAALAVARAYLGESS